MGITKNYSIFSNYHEQFCVLIVNTLMKSLVHLDLAAHFHSHLVGSQHHPKEALCQHTIFGNLGKTIALMCQVIYMHNRLIWT
jgi:hypothetical protein